VSPRPAVGVQAPDVAGPAEAPDPASPVESMLSGYREIAIRALLDGLPSTSPAYLYDLLPEYPTRRGKGLRAAMCLATCSAYGGDLGRAVNSAVAIELFHNAFLIHDDIQDASEQRRGQATLSARYGSAIALNVGNATNLLALQRVRANRELLGGALAWRIFEETDTMLRHSLEGQAIELGWIRDNVEGLTDDDYLRMCLKKTSWYTCLYPCRVGILIAADGRTEASALDRFGWFLGAAFQIQDDVLNLVGGAEYGKEIAGDLYEGKRTLMLIHLQQRLRGNDRRRLRRFLATPRAQRAAPDVAWARELLDEHGSIQAAIATAQDLAHAARGEAERALAAVPDGPDRDFLLALPEYVVSRQR
jgi:geranylgeranyl diphosphate synthase type II